ncbi:MAG: hypothetical protein JNL58_29755 [Planctomyces sp.]|nr:hypothetical protein [Planctomyces sp.]
MKKTRRQMVLCPLQMQRREALVTLAALGVIQPYAKSAESNAAESISAPQLVKDGVHVTGDVQAQSSSGSTGHLELTAGDLTAVVGDNSERGEHRAGYNGVWALRHRSSSRNLFVPAVSGLNFEHIITGEHLEDRTTFFEPRNAPMTLSRMSEAEVELHQAPTPTFHVESWTRFRITAPHYLDMQVRFKAHEDVFSRGYLSLFWASYMNAPADKSMYFLGFPEGFDFSGRSDSSVDAIHEQAQWIQLCTQWHNDQSTVQHWQDRYQMSFPAQGRDALFKNISKLRFDRPFFYGRIDNLSWLVMFDRSAGIRFTHSPSGGGTNAEFKTTNPAWDFQYYVEKPQIGREYSFQVRTVLRPECSREEILEEFRIWDAVQRK